MSNGKSIGRNKNSKNNNKKNNSNKNNNNNKNIIIIIINTSADKIPPELFLGWLTFCC